MAIFPTGPRPGCGCSGTSTYGTRKASHFSLSSESRDGRLIGWTGVIKPHWFPEMMPTPEIGWFIDRELWGQGFATEGAAAALHFALGDVKIERVIGIYNTENAASGRVMEKIGMTFWKEVPHPGSGSRFESTKSAARAARPAACRSRDDFGLHT